MKNDLSYMGNIFDNRLTIAKSQEQLGYIEQSLEECTKTFNMITRKTIWKPEHGKYIVEILKVVFKIAFNQLNHTKKCNIYYIIDLIHISFNSRQPVSFTSYVFIWDD